VKRAPDAVVIDQGLRRLALRTWQFDRRTYRTTPEPLSVRRLWRAVVPRLRRPIFVVGSPRSGTTFLGECLEALPEVSYHYEPIATKAAARLVYDGTWGFHRAKFFYRQVYAWLMRVHFDGHRRFAEKNPDNCFIVPFLHRAFPDAQFLHIIRDGRDAALSHSKKPWLQAAAAASGRRDPGGYLDGPYRRFWVEPERSEEFETTSDIHRCIWAWRRYNEAVLASRAALRPAQYRAIRYESLVMGDSAEAQKVVDFLEIGKAGSRDRFYEAVDRRSPDSVGRWRVELTPLDVAQVEAEAGELLSTLGYSARMPDRTIDQQTAPSG